MRSRLDRLLIKFQSLDKTFSTIALNIRTSDHDLRHVYSPGLFPKKKTL